MAKTYMHRFKQTKSGVYVSTKTNKTIHYRSQLELDYCLILDADVSVKDWKYESFPIPVIIKGTFKTYWPDFLVEHLDGSFEVIEVKPKKLQTNPKNVAKMESLQRFCDLKQWKCSFWP